MLVDAPGAKATVTGAIQNAARVTGTKFQYLLATAQVESNFNANASAATSSARGLFQFIGQTWLATIKEHGASLGYAQMASAIERQPSGQYTVADRQTYDQIMRLRSDPAANALMAGAFTKDNAAKLTSRLGRPPTDGELYLAHFLGANGAGRLIELAQSQPGARAADAFPQAAHANRSIFFDRQGQARRAADVYRVLVNRYEVASGGPAKQVVPQLAAIAPAPLRRTAPDTAQIAETYAAASSPMPPATRALPAVQAADAGPVFHGLFRTSARREAVAPVVSALWSAPVAPQAPASVHGPDPVPVDRGGPLDLFQDQAPDARALFRGRA